MADIENDMDPNDQAPEPLPISPYAPDAMTAPAPDASAPASDGTGPDTVAANDDQNQDQSAAPESTDAVAESNGEDQAAPAAADVGPSAVVPTQPYAPITPHEDSVQRNLQDIYLANDLKGNAIKPETYHDLWAKNADGSDKGTLSKIGSLFALMLAGAGSGLAHQSNSVMDMWNNQINRDVDAQKSTSKGRQSFYALAMQRENNIANNEKTRAETEGQLAGNYGKQILNERDQYANDVIPGLKHLGATAQARNASWLFSVQHQQDIVNNMADGPAKVMAQNQIDTVVRPRAMAEIAKNNAELEQAKSLVNVVRPDPAAKLAAPSDPRGPAVNEKLLESKRVIGAIDPNNPAGIPPAEMPAITAARNSVQQNRANLADWMDMYKDLQNTKNAGQVPLVTGANKAIAGLAAGIGTGLEGLVGGLGGGALGSGVAAGVSSLADLYERKRNAYADSFKHRLGANYSTDDKNKIINALFPSWVDKPNDPTFWNNGMQHFKSNEAAFNGALKNRHVDTPFPQAPFVPPKNYKRNISQNNTGSENPVSTDYP